MNCKPGDMAIIVGGDIDGVGIGKIVKCLHIADEPSIYYSTIWAVDRDLEWLEGYFPLCPDKHLRPIRPSEDMDEMLRIVGLPEKETA